MTTNPVVGRFPTEEDMAKRFSLEEVMQMIELQLKLEYPELNRDKHGLYIPFALIVQNDVIKGMIVAERGEDIDSIPGFGSETDP